MPSPIIARKSGIHRAACLALFRALFRQINRLELVQPQKSALQSRLRKGIRDYLGEQSNSAIVAALRRGYALLKTLREGVDQPNSPLHAYGFAAIPTATKPSPHAKPLPSSLLSKPPSKVTTNYPRRGPVVWPRPNTPSIFDRPFPRVSGQRHVPHLVVANGFPFLRIKKPQSQYLGRIIRDDIRLYQKRILRFQKFETDNSWGLDEDIWDQTLKSICGVKQRREENVSWSHETQQAMRDVFAQIRAHQQKRVDMAQKLQEIVEKEQALFDQERMERRREKRRERNSRRLQRKAASDEAPSDEAPNDGAPSNETV